MTGKTHRIIGLVAGGGYFLATASGAYQPATLGAVIVASYLGSLIPDADDAGADIWHTLPFGHTVGKITDPLLKHRNISHSLVGIGIYTIILLVILRLMPSYWGISIMPVLIASSIAYASHLLVDSFTVEGIPFLWPWSRMLGIPPKPFDGIRIQTGKWFENLVVFPAVNISLIIFVVSYWQKIKSLILK
ncbi:MAG: metal-dependent hydrolase [Candidatus Berkelbacteria bacterium]|nr:metal-dependent hydrolase [Candidatus Berkelbacteria bacterium]